MYVLEVFVIGEDRDQELGSFQPVSPLLHRQLHCQEFAITNMVILFCEDSSLEKKVHTINLGGSQ